MAKKMKVNQLQFECSHKKKVKPSERETEEVSNIDDLLNWFLANDPIRQTHNNGRQLSESFLYFPILYRIEKIFIL